MPPAEYLNDPTFHRISHNGETFAVSAYPFGPNAAGGKYWSVQTGDGTWHVVCPRTSAASKAQEQQRADAAIVAWLSDRDRGEASE